MYECPTPYSECSGKITQVEPRNRIVKTHAKPNEIKRCVRRWLRQAGYGANPNREFHRPGEPVLVVSKKSGMRLRKGKENTRVQAKELNSPIKPL